MAVLWQIMTGRNYCRWTCNNLKIMPTSTQSLLTRFQVLLRNCKMPLPVVQKSFHLLIRKKRLMWKKVKISSGILRQVGLTLMMLLFLMCRIENCRKLKSTRKAWSENCNCWTDRLWKNYNHKSFDEIL